MHVNPEWVQTYAASISKFLSVISFYVTVFAFVSIYKA